MLETVEEELLSGKKYNGKDIESFAEYKYILAERDMLIWMLQPKQRVKKEEKEIPEKILPEFGIHNPIHEKKKDGTNKKRKEDVDASQQ